MMERERLERSKYEEGEKRPSKKEREKEGLLNRMKL